MLTIPQEIKDLLHLDHCKKNIRIHFPNGERTDICNDLIVKDSVQFTESLCSQDSLKFGLCESPIFECETVGVGNIKGATIEVSCEIYCEPTVSGSEFKTDIQHYIYSIPYGTFVVNEAKRQADMIHRRIVAYGGTATFYSGISNSFEQRKDYYYPGPFSSIVYDANTFLLAVSNIGVKQYSPSVFNATEVTPGSTSNETIQTPKTWRYNGSQMYIVFGFTRKDYGNDFATRDVLCQINGDIDEDFVNQVVDDAIEMGLRYGMPADFMTRQQWKQMLNYMWASYSDSQYGPYEKSIKYNSLPFLCYPFLEEGNGGISVAYRLRYIYISSYGSGVLEQITYDQDYIDNLTVLKLTSKYPELNNYTTHFENVPIGSSYNRQFIPPEDYDSVKELNRIIELSGLFGFTHRNSSFDLVNIKRQFGLLPDTTTYPESTLYPSGVVGGSIKREDYQSCWYDDEYTKPYGLVKCTYKDSNNDEITELYFLTGYDGESDPETYLTYDLSDNEIIRNNIWTGTDIHTICQRVATNIEGVSYMPVDFVGRGLPYVEAGDTFEILTRSNDSITTIVLNKTTSGEQTLTDSYKSV